MKRDIVIIIPAYNPDEKLINVVNKILECGIDKIIIVNDGSKKQDIFNKIKDRVKILTHQENKGKGQALKTAFQYCVNNESNIIGVITVDADGQHDIKDVKKLYTILNDTIILGTRNFDKAPFFSKIGNEFINRKIEQKTNIKVKDSQTGLRAIPAKYLEDFIKIEGSRYEYETNMLLYCIKNKIPIEECDINTIYIDENKGSNFKKISDSISVYNVLKNNKKIIDIKNV